MTRLTDNDRRLGKHITYGRTQEYRPISISYSSGGEDEGRPYNHLMVWAFGWVACVRMPHLLEPYREKVHAKYWSPADVERMGRDWYWSVDERKYGFSYNDGFLQVYRGRQTGDSTTDQTRSWSMPWTNWHVRRKSLYGPDGDLAWSYVTPYGAKGMPYFDAFYAFKEKELEMVSFTVEDAGTALLATTYLEEIEFTRGTGRWSWLRFFSRRRIRRSLDISFSREVGNEKGSWKGGLVGCSIDAAPGETHESAMRRWCDQEHRDKGGKFRVKFIGAAT